MGEKRKAQVPPKKKAKSTKSAVEKPNVAELAEGILESTKNYNNIVTLLGYVDDANVSDDAIASLVKVFGMLIKRGALKTSKSQTDAQKAVVTWLRNQYNRFTDMLLSIVQDEEEEEHYLVALSAFMKLVKAEAKYHGEPPANKLFGKIINALARASSTVADNFVDEYIEQFDDLRYHLYNHVESISTRAYEDKDVKTAKVLSDGLVDMLISITSFSESDGEIESFYFPVPEMTKSAIKQGSALKASSHKAAFQRAWLSVLRLPLTVDQYKAILIVLHKRIIPRMSKPQLLMDFLTDAYNSGGAVALLALNGLFSLMQQYNLDYPDFFTKLYALFDSSIMHARYRSRFLRLVDLFLSSSHLPVAIMASFIKRMARLSLHAPPSAIIAVVPFIYNQLKRHPACMKMIHNPDAGNDYQDPFDEHEKDPLRTNALDSSLWELATLQTHYHPNVATLAKIMSQPFRKPYYSLEDFYNHTYGQLIQAELTKTIRSKPALEFEEFKMFDDDESPNVYMSGWTW